MQAWMVTSRGCTSHCGLVVKGRQTGFNPPQVTRFTSMNLSCPICEMGMMIIYLIWLLEGLLRETTDARRLARCFACNCLTRGSDKALMR